MVGESRLDLLPLFDTQIFLIAEHGDERHFSQNAHEGFPGGVQSGFQGQGPGHLDLGQREAGQIVSGSKLLSRQGFVCAQRRVERLFGSGIESGQSATGEKVVDFGAQGEKCFGRSRSVVSEGQNAFSPEPGFMPPRNILGGFI